MCCCENVVLRLLHLVGWTVPEIPYLWSLLELGLVTQHLLAPSSLLASVQCTHHYITLHYITLHYITLDYIRLHYITLDYITLHYITLHYIHYITLHYITLHYITLHWRQQPSTNTNTNGNTRSKGWVNVLSRDGSHRLLHLVSTSVGWTVLRTRVL